MDRLKIKPLARAAKPKRKNYLAKLKRIYGMRKALIDLSIQIEKHKGCQL